MTLSFTFSNRKFNLVKSILCILKYMIIVFVIQIEQNSNEHTTTMISLSLFTYPHMLLTSLSNIKLNWVEDKNIS